MITKKSKIYASYFSGRFRTKEEILEFKFACIGPSKESKFAGSFAGIGQTVNLEFCLKQRCTCGYTEALKDAHDRLKNEKSSIDFIETDPKEESISIAKSLLDDSEKERERNGKNVARNSHFEEQRPETENKGTEKRTGSRKKRKQKNENSDNIQRMLFGE